MLTLARHAMNTRFEILLEGEDLVQLRAAGEAALDEIDRLEAQLSIYRPTSEVSRVNHHAAQRPVVVSPPVFSLLRHAQALSVATQGAFDPTIGPLVNAWGFRHGSGRQPAPNEVAEARSCVGMEHVHLDDAGSTVQFCRTGMSLDLGAIGKGYAIDVAIDTLREAGVTAAFIHGGTSSSYGLGTPKETPAWLAAIPDPRPDADRNNPPVLLAEIPLNNESLGVSGVWSKHFHHRGRLLGHVIDPRSGEPAQRALLAAVVLPSATETDALSTALLTLGRDGLDLLARLRPEARLLVAEPSPTSDDLILHRHPCLNRL